MTYAKPAVVLLSGGLDSTTILAIAKSECYTPYALSFRYGQRHAVELNQARQVAQALGAAAHVVVDIDLRQFGGSALTADIAVPMTCPGFPSTSGLERMASAPWRGAHEEEPIH